MTYGLLVLFLRVPDSFFEIVTAILASFEDQEGENRARARARAREEAESAAVCSGPLPQTSDAVMETNRGLSCGFGGVGVGAG